MKQICAKCKGTNVAMLTDGRSSDRIEEYRCKDCMIVFFAKRPTKRVGQRERGRVEYLDHMAGLAMLGLASSQDRPGALDKEASASWAYDLADAMWAERENR